MFDRFCNLTLQQTVGFQCWWIISTILYKNGLSYNIPANYGDSRNVFVFKKNLLWSEAKKDLTGQTLLLLWSLWGLTASLSRAQAPNPVRQRDQRASAGHLWPAHVAWVSEGARVGGCMGPWEEGRQCVGACVAWCDLAHVYVCGMHACTCLYWHGYSDAYFISSE